MNVKIFGERHTATNAITEFVHLNFNALCNDYGFLGWKHRRAPLKSEWQRVNYRDTLFIFTVRHPYSWAKSMHREPYCMHHPQLKKMTFDDFLIHPIEDYENILKMWNQKYQSYIDMCEQVPNSLILRMEHFISDQKNAYNQLCLHLDAKENFQIYNKYITGKGVAGKKISLAAVGVELTPEQKIIINKQIDQDLVAKLGYGLELQN